jgi:hypothetical protein
MAPGGRGGLRSALADDGRRDPVELTATRDRHSYMDTSYLDTMTGWVR